MIALIPINPTTINDGTISDAVGADNFAKVTDDHCTIYGNDAYTPQWYDVENNEIITSEHITKLQDELN